MSKTGVIIVNTGTPEEPTPQGVKRYLGKFLMDSRIVPMNRACWWLILHLCILPRRSVRSAEKYQKIWTPEGSPLRITQEKLASGLAGHYEQCGLDVSVKSAMSYGSPSIASALRELMDEGCESLVVLPLYPQSAYSTTGSVSDGTRRAVKKLRFKGQVTIIDGYHDDPVYVRAIAASIKHAGFEVASDDRLVFSFHSIPLVDIENGDTYELQTGATSLAVADELGLDRKRWTVGYQCQFDKGRTWLTPFTRNTLASWAETGLDARVFIVCPNFAIDCLETIYDIEHELKPAYLEQRRAMGRECVDRTAEVDEVAAREEASRTGAHARINVFSDDDALVYVPCLNKSKAHVRVLAHVLAPYVGDEVESD